MEAQKLFIVLQHGRNNVLRSKLCLQLAHKLYHVLQMSARRLMAANSSRPPPTQVVASYATILINKETLKIRYTLPIIRSAMMEKLMKGVKS